MEVQGLDDFVDGETSPTLNDGRLIEGANRLSIQGFMEAAVRGLLTPEQQLLFKVAPSLTSFLLSAFPVSSSQNAVDRSVLGELEALTEEASSIRNQVMRELFTNDLTARQKLWFWQRVNIIVSGVDDSVSGIPNGEVSFTVVAGPNATATQIADHIIEGFNDSYFWDSGVPEIDGLDDRPFSAADAKIAAIENRQKDFAELATQLQTGADVVVSLVPYGDVYTIVDDVGKGNTLGVSIGIISMAMTAGYGDEVFEVFRAATGKAGEVILRLRKVPVDEVVAPWTTAPAHSFERVEALSGNASRRLVDSLTESMKKNGWQGAPIEAIEHNGYRYIVDGHHRVAAARRAGIEVPYELIDEATLIKKYDYRDLKH